MEISLISENKLKISLTKEDFEKLGISYNTMSHSDDMTRKALIKLLDQAKLEVGFSPRGSKLFIEVYQSDDGGGELYFTCIRRAARMPDSSAVIAPAVFEFDNADDLIDGALKTTGLYRHRIYKSSLYLLDAKYRLLVYHLDYADKLSVYFLSEFGRKLSEDEIFAAYTIEYGKELIADTALDTLAEIFSKPGPETGPP